MQWVLSVSGSESTKLMEETTGVLITSSIDRLSLISGSTAFKMYEGVVPEGLLCETSLFLESLLLAATSGKVWWRCSSTATVLVPYPLDSHSFMPLYLVSSAT